MGIQGYTGGILRFIWVFRGTHGYIEVYMSV